MDRRKAERVVRVHKEPQGVFEKLLALVTNQDDPERKKRRLLKGIRRDLNKNRRYKFYKPRGNEMQPGLARFIHEIYKAVVPAKTILRNAAGSKALQSIVIENFMSKEQTGMLAQFAEDRIGEAGERSDIRELSGELRQAMVDFFASFDNVTVKQINATYNTVRSFVHFVGFDFYLLLKKFDPGITEANPSYKPSFQAIGGESITDDLKDFLEIAPAIDKSADWDRVLGILQQYRGIEVISRAAWKKVMNSVTDVVQSEVLLKIVRYVEQDPFLVVEPNVPQEHIVEPYLNAVKTTTEATIQKLSAERRERKVQQLSHKIFGNTTVLRTKYYTEAASQVYAKRHASGYTLTAPMSYLKAFLVDYCKKDVRELVRDVLLVRGRWAATVTSHQLSEAFHETMALADQILEFDNSLADDGERGAKLRKALGRTVERDQKSLKLLQDQLSEVNQTAHEIIVKSAQHLITIGKILRAVIEDADRQESELIVNWRELQGYVADPLKNRLTEINRQIYYFVELMRIYVKTV